MTEKNKKQMESDHILSREERIQEIQSFNLLSDVFMSVALDDIPACQHILRILTGMDDLKVKTVRTQYAISRIKTHSVRLDVLAETEKGKLYHIEIQRKDEIDPTKRIRYNGSLMDAEFLAKGIDYKDLPDRIHFYISENDIWHCGKAIYPVGKTLEDTGIPYDDSEGELSKRVRYLKKEEGGVEIMCEVSDRIMERGRKIGEEQMLNKLVRKNLSRGMSIAEIAEVLDEPERRIREIMESEALKQTI